MSPAEEGTLELRVRTPQPDDPDDAAKTFSYNRGHDVRDAANEAAEAYNLETGEETWTFKVGPADPLNPDTQLAATDLEDGDLVTLTDFGRGV